MTLFRVTPDRLDPVQTTSFVRKRILERLQGYKLRPKPVSRDALSYTGAYLRPLFGQSAPARKAGRG
jgi:hypothetical protein